MSLLPQGTRAEDLFELQLARTMFLQKEIYSEVLGAFGLETFEFHVITRLAEEDGLSQAELGARVLRGKVAISRLVDTLVERGLVTRAADRRDTRVWNIRLTPRARKLFPKALAAVRATSRRVLAGLSAREEAQLNALLVRVQESLVALRTERANQEVA